MRILTKYFILFNLESFFKLFTSFCYAHPVYIYIKLSSPNIEIPEMQTSQDDSSTTSLNISNQTPDMPEATEETTPHELARRKLNSVWTTLEKKRKAALNSALQPGRG